MRRQRGDGSVAAPAAFLDRLCELAALRRASAGVRRTAFAEAAPWRGAGAGVARPAVDLDASRVAGGGRAKDLLASIDAGPPSPADVEVVVSENVLERADLDRLVDGLVMPRAAGVRLSLDDFGTGYVSLTRIADLPIDLVELEARLVRDAAENARTRLVVEGVVALLHELQLACVFEGARRRPVARSPGRWARAERRAF
jgi:EAL domain-containing protein (putative c-di-GMP-specific phosphodiesterase class I)